MNRPTANDYTDLRDRPKRWWGITWLSRVTGHGILMPGLGGAIVVFILALLPVIALSQVGGSRVAVPGIVIALALAVAVYTAWDKFRPGGMTFGAWLIARLDYIFRQPRRFYGLQRDKEPTTLRWTVIVYEPAPAPTKKRGPRA